MSGDTHGLLEWIGTRGVGDVSRLIERAVAISNVPTGASVHRQDSTQQLASVVVECVQAQACRRVAMPVQCGKVDLALPSPSFVAVVLRVARHVLLLQRTCSGEKAPFSAVKTVHNSNTK